MGRYCAQNVREVTRGVPGGVDAPVPRHSGGPLGLPLHFAAGRKGSVASGSCKGSVQEAFGASTEGGWGFGNFIPILRWCRDHIYTSGSRRDRDNSGFGKSGASGVISAEFQL
jgi:hypothetical protein